MSHNDNSQKSANRQIARAAGTVMFAFIVSNVIGIIAKTLTARAFGTSTESEAFYAANRFSEILFNLIAGGALGSAFIPTFTELLVKDDKKGAWNLASAILNWVVLVLTILSIFTFVFSRQVVHYILAPGFSAVSLEKEILTSNLLRIQIFSSVIFGVSGMVMGILNAHQRFLIPSLAPAMYQLGWILGVILLSPEYGVKGLSFGILIGSGMHLVVQLPVLLKLKKIHFNFNLGLKNSAVKKVALLMAPRLIGVAVVQLNFLLNTYLASQQPEGSVTALSLAFPLMIMPQAAIAQSIAIASLPTFSAQIAAGKLSEMRSSFVQTLRMIFFLTIPATIGLIYLRNDLISFLYQGGEFDTSSTALVSWALLWYAVGLVGHSIVEITSRAFYSLKDTRTPVTIGVVAMSLNLVFSIILSGIFEKNNLFPHGGLALANSLATAIESVILLLIMSRRLNGLEGRRLVEGLWKAILSSACMMVFLLIVQKFLSEPTTMINILATIIVAILSYALFLFIFKVQELSILIKMIRRK